MKNDYEIRGDVTAIFLRRKDGSVLETLIATEDLALVDMHPGAWSAQWNRTSRCFYAIGTCRVEGKRQRVQMHRLILNPDSDKVVDHINHDGLDNRRANLRPANKSINALNGNGLRGNNRSGYRGVSWVNRDKKWVAHIGVNGKQYWLGSYDSKDEAKRAYDERLHTLFPELAPTT